MKGWLWFVLAFVTCMLHGHHARANMAKWWSDGETHGALVPQSDSNIRVDSEDLSFVVAPKLTSAEVTATYHMTNGGSEDAHIEVAFVMVSREDATNVAEASVTIDGAPVESRHLTEAEVLAPMLDAWLEAHPEADEELKRLEALPRHPDYSETGRLRRLAPGCGGDCSDLIRWHGEKKVADVPGAAKEAIPEAVAGVQRGWVHRGYQAPLSWLTFPLAIGAGASRTVRVHYTHIAGSDAGRAANTVFTYEYLLSPAKRWARFGELRVSVELPPDTTMQASTLAFTPNGRSYRATQNGLPAGELTFELMSRKGLLFGMTQPWGYWLVLMALMTLTTVYLARGLGRYYARDTKRVVLASTFGTGIASLLWNGVLSWAFSQVVPQHAFGHSYDVILGFFVVLVLYAVVAIVTSITAARRATAATVTTA